MAPQQGALTRPPYHTGLPRSCCPLPPAAGLLGGQALYLYGDYWLGMWASKSPEEQLEVRLR